MEINDNIKKKFNNFYQNEKVEFVTKKNLSIAIRRYVSRYLSGKRGENEINERNNLKYYLSKQELWDEIGIIYNDKFDIELNLLFDEDGSPSMVCVGQATKLYEFLGGDKSLLNEYYNKIEEFKKKENEKDILNNPQNMIELKELPPEEEKQDNEFLNDNNNIDDEDDENNEYNNDDDGFDY
jgi:hypothetical protein